MYQLILLATIGLLPSSLVLRQTVDLIEVNHLFDEQGQPVFSQVIFYDWHAETARYEVRAWRLLKSPHQVPRRDFLHGGYSCIWNDGGDYRWIFSPAVRESWTQYDPELVERERLPRERRLELLISRDDLFDLSRRASGPVRMAPVPAEAVPEEPSPIPTAGQHHP